MILAFVQGVSKRYKAPACRISLLGHAKTNISTEKLLGFTELVLIKNIFNVNCNFYW